ncbi:uncharacterized protein LOC110944193 [Helianthus annuus]|uniref:uncharacterized protein LOC110944193 n=1 Tax=Helianthus annuus TaxID=4232 RepID=UPI000B905775|nr:uncharacterized protein LOC110944193 [Helianthus annuus]
MKTKDLSLAVGESSLVQLITARKRGRPRKIVEKSEEECEEETEVEKHQDLQQEMDSKKAKSNEELVKEEATEEPSPLSTTSIKDQPRRSRRKSKPIKSC